MGAHAVFRKWKLNMEALTWTVGQVKEGHACLSGSSDQEWGLESLNSLCGHSLMLGYTTDKNPYKYPDTEIINYPFYPSVSSLKVH